MQKYVFDKSTANEQSILLSNLLEQQRQQKKTLLSYLEKVSEYISEYVNNKTNTEDIEKLLSCLNNVQEIFDTIKYTIDKIVELKLFIENISKSTSLNIIDFEKYNSQFAELSEKINTNNIAYSNFIENLIAIPYLDFSDLKNTYINNSSIENTVSESEIVEEFSSDIEENSYPENEVDEDISPIIEETTPSENEVAEDISPIIEETTPSENEVAEDISPIIEETTSSENEITEDVSTDIEETTPSENEITEDVSTDIEETTPSENEVDEDISPIIEETTSSENEITEDVSTDIEETTPSENEITEDVSTIIEENTVFMEKILFINNKEQIAILPYSLLDLEEFFSNNPEKYSSINDIIKKEYTISLNDYENTSISRFKQTFKLAKERSNFSFFESLNYAKKLFFENQVEPIIIAACSNIEELETYLDCLNNNILNEFDYFTIIKK